MIESTVPVLEFVQDAYVKFGTEINRERALPDVRDGLKPVQRRVLLGAIQEGARNSFQRTITVASSAVGHYHAHGESSVVGAITTMVNARCSLLDKHGDFGRKGYISTEAAAPRYTSVKISKIANSLYLGLLDFVPTFVNDLDNKEPEFLASGIPYCLLSSAFGIGLGVRTYIPAVDLNDLSLSAKAYLHGSPIPVMKLVSPGGGWIKIDPKNLKSVNEKGVGEAIIGAVVKQEPMKDGTIATVVGAAPEGIEHSWIDIALRKAIDDGWVYIRDESAKDIRIVIKRNKRKRGKITDQEIYDKVRNKLSQRVTFDCFVSYQGKAHRMGLQQMLQISLDHVVKVWKEYLGSRIHKLDLELTFIRVRDQLAPMLLNKVDLDVIQKKLGLTQEELDYCIAKTIKSLSATFDPAGLKEQHKDLTSDLEQPKYSYYSKSLEKGLAEIKA